VIEDDPLDPNHAVLAENVARLQSLRDAADRPLRIVTLPMPPPLEHEGQRLPASYGNFYIGNAAVLLPVFGGPRDREVVATLTELFPTRRIVPIDATDLVWGLGAFHCVTQQQPEVGREDQP